MTETELKRIEYMIRVMSSHQVTNRNHFFVVVKLGIKYGSNESQVALLYG